MDLPDGSAKTPRHIEIFGAWQVAKDGVPLPSVGLSRALQSRDFRSRDLRSRDRRERLHPNFASFNASAARSTAPRPNQPYRLKAAHSAEALGQPLM